MDFDLTQLPTGMGGWRALVDHALALGDLAEVDYLELKGTLPFAVARDRKHSAVVIAKAVLGISNRMPDAAEGHLGGFGVVLVGIYDGRVVGAERVDGAVLHDHLEPYIGDDGPRWDYVYIDHPDGLVLAVVVGAPRWGDRINPVRKEYTSPGTDKLAVRDGEVFVRRPGKTRPATSADLADLEVRRSRSPSVGAQVRVGYTDTFDRVDSASIHTVIVQLVNKTADDLLDELDRRQSVRGMVPSVVLDVGKDRRTPKEFRDSVESWREKSLTKASGVVTEFLRHQLARGHWAIHNDSMTYLEAVRVQIEVPAGVQVLQASDTEYCDHGGPFELLALFAKPPLQWGSFTLSSILNPARFDRVRSLVVPSTAEVVTVDPASGAAHVTWKLGDLRPGSTEIGEELFAVVTDGHLTDVVASWRVTARGINHVFEGALNITCGQQPHVHLQWGPAKPQIEN